MNDNKNTFEKFVNIDIINSIIDETNEADDLTYGDPIDSEITDEDIKERFYNTAIYIGRTPLAHGDPESIEWANHQFEEYKRKFYGDKFDELNIHKPDDPRVVEMLLDMAIKKGSAITLPEKLHNL